MDNALFADLSTRTIRGLVLPYNELSRRSVSGDPVMFEKGTLELPRDPEIVTLNEGHSQFAPVGRALELTDTDKGVEAAFKVANTPEGDDLLLRANDPDEAKRPRLSAEVANLLRKGQKAVSGRLTGVAVVPMGAFASAGLFELAEGEAEQVEEELTVDLTDQIKEAVADAVAAITNPEAAPAEDNQEGAFAVSNAPATVPQGLTPKASDTLTANGLFAAIAHKDSEVLTKTSALGDLFAISTIQHSGPTTLTIGADVQVPQALGEIWKRRRYERRFAPLFTSQALTSMKATGWRWVDDKEPTVAAYSGNTAEIPSNAVDTEQVTADAVRLAGGHKLDRRFLDFPDQGVIESYFTHMAEDYSRKSDAAFLAAAVSGATTLTDSDVPGTGITNGLQAIVTGALAVIAAENTPSFAVVSAELWKAIVLTPDESVLGYLNAGFGLEEGSAAGFKILPGAVGTGKVLVGAKEAMTVFELPGAPIRVEGIDPHHGAIDPALFGYYATIINAAKGLQLVTAYTAG